MVLPAVVAAVAYALTVHQVVPHVGVLAGAALLAAVLNLPDAFVDRRLGFLARIGDASYSLYLGHWLLAGVAAQFAWGLGLPDWFGEPYRCMYIAASVALSLVVYRIVEAPVIGLGHRLAGAGRIGGLRPDRTDAASHGLRATLTILLVFAAVFASLTFIGRARHIDVRSLPVDRTAASAAGLIAAVDAARHGAPSSKAYPGRAMSVSTAEGRVIVDVERVSRADCVNGLLRADTLPGLVIASGSSRAADERSVPVSEKDAKAVCRRSLDNAMRFIFAAPRPPA